MENKFKNVGEYIKFNREKKNISIRELARRIHVDNSGLAKIEKGKVKKPDALILRKISDELNLNEIILYQLAGYEPMELLDMGIMALYIKDYIEMKGAKKLERYFSKSEDGEQIIDIIKVLQAYRDKKINEAETIGLLMCRIPYPIDKCILPEQREKYGINSDVVKDYQYFYVNDKED